ncbi:MAG: HEAT repeat domain-containing protein [Thermoguttaceae bacterium]
MDKLRIARKFFTFHLFPFFLPQLQTYSLQANNLKIRNGTVYTTHPVSAGELLSQLKSADEPLRIKRIDELGSLGVKASEAVGPLTELLKDKSAPVRAHAARALGEIGAPAKSAAAGLASLLKDPDETVRRQTVEALRAIRPGPQVMLPLLSKLLEDSDPGVQMRILQAIAEAGPAAVPGLIQALKNDKTTYWACIVLREIGPAAKDAAPALAEKLKDPRPEIRREAALALGALNEAAIPVLPQIAAALDDEDARTAATFIMGQLGKIPANAEAKIRANAASDDKFLSTISLWTLARVHPEDKELRRQATVQLAERLKDQDPFVRVAAARALTALPPAPEITLPILEKALKDADTTTIQHALDALASLGPQAVPRLVEILKQHKELRIQVAYTLGQIGPGAAAATEALAGLVADEDFNVSTEAVLALGKIGPAATSAVPALMAALQKEHCPNAHAIIYALGRIGPKAAAAQPLLLSAMNGEDKSLAVIAAWAFTQIQPSSAQIAKSIPVLVPKVLVPGLSDSLPETRKAAAEALCELGPLARDAIPALQKTAKDDSSKAVRDAAAKALESISKQKSQ